MENEGTPRGSDGISNNENTTESSNGRFRELTQLYRERAILDRKLLPKLSFTQETEQTLGQE